MVQSKEAQEGGDAGAAGGAGAEHAYLFSMVNVKVERAAEGATSLCGHCNESTGGSLRTSAFTPQAPTFPTYFHLQCLPKVADLKPFRHHFNLLEGRPKDWIGRKRWKTFTEDERKLCNDVFSGSA